MKTLRYIFAALISFVAISTYAQTKEQKKAAKIVAIKALVDNQNFNFIAQYALPKGGARRYLTSNYDLKVKRDSLIAYLPYFGEAYFDVPYNPTDGGIKFTSTKFTFKVTPRKKGGWDILIEPSDVKYYQRINILVNVDGYTTVYFTITNKSYINFDGYIESNDKSKQ